MRFPVITIVMVFLLNPFLKSNECNYKLTLTNNNYDIHAGDIMTFTLYLSGEDIINLNKSIVFDLNGIYQGSNILAKNHIDKSNFEQKIIIEAKESGLFKLGPYKLNIGNCVIESNILEIIIQKRKEQIIPDKIISFGSSNITLKLGDTAKVKMKANFRGLNLPKDENKNLHFKRGYSSENMSTYYGKSEINSEIELYIIPLRKGTFILNSDYFEDIDKITIVKELKINVE
jgi:hypothetical protein